MVSVITPIPSKTIFLFRFFSDYTIIGGPGVYVHRVIPVFGCAFLIVLPAEYPMLMQSGQLFVSSGPYAGSHRYTGE
jgi:hypothetical protein